MRRAARLAGWLGWSLAPALAWAQGPTHPAPFAPNQIGVVAAVQGQVEVTKIGTTVGRIVDSGEAMLLGDTVKTDPDERLQILLLDQTVFTIGPNSAIVIDEFIYDPATDAGTLSAQILKGTFRFVTGKIAHKNPESMTVKLPTGTIGVRGTMVVGNCEGQISSVALIGPGAIVVSNEVAGATRQVSVTRTGFGTTIGGVNVPPTPPSFVPPAELNAWAAALGFTPTFQGAPPGQQPGQPGQQPTGPQQPSGPEGRFGPTAEGRFGPGPEGEGRFGPGPDGTFGGPEGMPHGEGFFGEGMAFGEGMFSPEGMLEGPDGASIGEWSYGPGGEMHFGTFGFDASGQFLSGESYALYLQLFGGAGIFVDPNQAQQSASQSTGIANEITTFDQLRDAFAQNSGTASNYVLGGSFTQTAAGNFSGSSQLRLQVHFGNRVIGGAGSTLRVESTSGNGNIDSTLNIAEFNFSSASGQAIVQPTGTVSPTGSFSGTTFTFENAAGTVAQHVDVHIEFSDNGGAKAGTGEIQDAPRVNSPL